MANFRIREDFRCGNCGRAQVEWGRIIFCPKCDSPDGSSRRPYFFMGQGKPTPAEQFQSSFFQGTILAANNDKLSIRLHDETQ